MTSSAANTEPTSAVTPEQLASASRRVIAALAGPGATVRPDQLEAVAALVVDRRRALVVQATGWGKSAVYWIAARAVRDSGGGPVLVVSPLLALMGDQVAAAGRAGLAAATLNSSNIEDWNRVETDLLAGRLDVLLVSPERLANPRFAAGVLTTLLPRLGLLVIDEAHCISSWGHDFRPDYQRIAALLLANPGLPVLATTATANARVTADIATQLGEGTFLQRGRLSRDSLHLGVAPGLSPPARYAWVDDALRTLPGSGIVYCLTVADAERLTGYLAHRGHAVASYTGKTETLERARVESALRANEVKAVVATSALGMGYDKPDLAFCLHVGSPGSPVDYYQQVGRAGRALETATVVLLPAEVDSRLWEWFATASVPDPTEAVAVLSAMAGGAACSIPELESATGVRRSRVELLVKVLAVEGAVERTVEGWVATGSPWSYDHPRYAAVVAARRGEADLMRAYAAGQDCLEVLLRRALDDPTTPGERCGRCSVCTGSLPAGLATTPTTEALLSARDWLRARDTELEPRKMWTAGVGAAAGRAWRGRIAMELSASTGRTLAFADDPGWEGMAAVTTSQGDQPAPDWLLDGLDALLARWRASWVAGPSAVVVMPSAGHPVLVGSLAHRVASTLGLPVLDVLEQVAPAPGRGLSPASRARAVAARLQLRQGAEVPRAAMLLVDDTWRTGWTATIAAALLRDAGATAVAPLVAHQLP